MFHVVLLEPEIPWNTGNIGRTCLALGATLHLVGRLGFHLGAKEVARAGLDYWEKVDVRRHLNWETFEKSLPTAERLFLFSAEAEQTIYQTSFRKGDYFLFGKESTGLPEELRERFRKRMFAIPQPNRENVRSLNLSTAVGIVLYEAYRQVAAASSGGRN